MRAVTERGYGAVTGARRLMRAIVLGVHVLDVLVRPVTEIPAGQGGQLVEEIRMTAAGTAGGTALTLAKLGAQVRSAGAIGDDALGDALIGLLQAGGVDTSLLLRRAGVQTSASVLPIRPDGSRPAFHVVGANATYTARDAPREAIAGATHLHLGAPEFMGGEQAALILRDARGAGVVTSADLLAPGEQAAQIRDWIAPALPHLDYLLPNDEQVLALTGADDLESGARQLVTAGVGCVAATRGADGALVVTATERARGSRLRDRGGRHHRLRGRVLGRLPARPGPRRGSRRRRAAGLRGRRAGRRRPRL